MQKILYSALTVALTILIAGFTKEDSSVITPTSDCYISSVTLGTMYRNVTQGGSTYQTSFSGSTYEISIDQINGIITNTKPLPARTVLTTVPLTLVAKGSVVFAPKPDDYPTELPSGWYSYTSAGGTIDFRKPVIFRTYATNGFGHREYLMFLTVREYEEGTYTWEALETDVLQGRGARQALPWQDGLLLLSADGEGKLHKVTFIDEVWSDDVLCTGADGAQVKTLLSFSNKLWMSTAAGAVICSDNGETWEPVDQAKAGDEVTLLAATEKLLYARIHNADASPADWTACSADGETWTPLALENDKSMDLFPKDAAALSFKIASVPYVMVAGRTDDDKTVVWVRHEKEDETWGQLEPENEASALTWQDGMTLLRYDNSTIALSGSQTETYYSPDNGLSWAKQKELVLPVTDANFAAAAQGGHIYIFAGEKVQRGNVN